MFFFNGTYIRRHKEPSHSNPCYFLEKYIIQMIMCIIYNRHCLLEKILYYQNLYSDMPRFSYTVCIHISIVHVVHWTITMLDWFTSLTEQAINARLWPDVSANTENSHCGQRVCNAHSLPNMIVKNCSTTIIIIMAWKIWAQCHCCCLLYLTFIPLNKLSKQNSSKWLLSPWFT